MQGLIRTWNSAENKNFVFMFPAVGLLGNCCINRAELCSLWRLGCQSQACNFYFHPNSSIVNIFRSFTDKIGWWTHYNHLSSLSDYNLDLIVKLSLNSEIQNTDDSLYIPMALNSLFALENIFCISPKTVLAGWLASTLEWRPRVL